jgi:hypothetical protein
MKENQEITTLDQPVEDTSRNVPASPLRRWLMRFGVAGFMFFFIKGLVWLAVIFGVGRCFV